tara:strand:+ start:147 stop:1070 length:924 start_codon:yes stop_codon:yes gene_type:complete
MDKGKIIGSIGIVVMAVLFCYFVLLSANSLNRAYADVTNSGATTNSQTNTSGSNTTISGGYASESTTTYSSGSSSNSTTNNDTTNTTNNKSTIPVPSSSAPSMSAYSQDVCVTGRSGGLQLPGVGLSGGTTVRDMNCERMKLSKLLNDYGMKVAAVSILCQDPRVFEAMEQAGTPCPFEGKIGKDAMAQWNKYDIERPDYDKYVEKMDDRLKIDERIMKDEGILKENESLKTNIKQVAKDNKKLEKQIKDLQKAQLELIEQSEKQIKVIEKLLPVHDESPTKLHESEVNDVEGFEEKKTSKFNSAGK